MTLSSIVNPRGLKPPPSHRVKLWRLILYIGVARLVWIAWALSVTLLVSITLMLFTADKKQFNAALETRLAVVAKTYAEFVYLQMASVDQKLQALRKGLSTEHGRVPVQVVVNDELSKLNGLVLQIATANAEGQITDSSLGTPNPPVNIGDRSHFLALKDNPEDRLVISEPVIGRVSKKPSLQLLRPLLSAEGKFDGVIVASINPEVLKIFFARMNSLDSDGRLSIIGLDGIVRFRLTKQGFTAGQDIKALPQWTQLSTLNEGLYKDASPIDNVARLSGFQRVQGYPLTVVVGTGLQQQTQSFNSRWTLIWGMVLALAAVLAAVAATISLLAKEQKHSYMLMKTNRQKEQENNRTKSSFLASVSHELRTPLNSILGFSELIRDTNADPRTSQYAGLIHKSGTQLHALVNTILDLTKIDSGKMGLVLENIDMVELLGTLTSIHKVSADQKDVELSLAVDGVTQGVVESDRTKLAQVLNNVIHNAIKFTQAGAIFVVMKPAGEAGLHISVIDSGIGISAKDIGQVFDRFNTIDAHIESGAEKGTGLGLALCRDLLNLMGGTIGLVSERDQGTTVDIFIPYKIPKEGNTA